MTMMMMTGKALDRYSWFFLFFIDVYRNQLNLFFSYSSSKKKSEFYDPSIFLPSIDTGLIIRSTESIHEYFRCQLLSKVGRPSMHIVPKGYLEGSTTGQRGCVDYFTVMVNRTHTSTFSLQNRCDHHYYQKN